MEAYNNNDIQEFNKNIIVVESYDNDSASDCESGVTGSSSSSPSPHRKSAGMFDENLAVELHDSDRTFQVICRRFLDSIDDATSDVKDNNKNINVVSIYRRIWSSDFLAQARVQSFQFHTKAMVSKLNANNGGNLSGPPVIKFAWFGASKQRVHSILARGFTFSDLQTNDNAAIILSPDFSPALSMEKSVEDENGVKHLLLCRVLLGKTEVIGPNSAQTEPSSEEFDSGVDDLENPSKYIIWSNNMNSHILPEYVVSFAPPPPQPNGYSKIQNGMKMPTSPWISFPALINVLGKFLPPDAVALISKHHKDYKERKICRPELIKIVRQIAGDKLLIHVIKSCKGAKESKMPFGFMRNRNANQQQ